MKFIEIFNIYEKNLLLFLLSYKNLLQTFYKTKQYLKALGAKIGEINYYILINE